MALHAIKAGEGDVFISAGVEMVSRFAQGQLRRPAGHREPAVRRRQGAHRGSSLRAAATWTDPREAGNLPDVYIAMGQTAENVAQLKGITREEQDAVRRAQPEPGREGHRQRVLGARHHAGDPARRHAGERRRRSASGRHDRGGLEPQAGIPPRRHGDRRELLPAQRRRGRCGDHVRHQGRRAGHHSAGARRQHRRHRTVAGTDGPRTDRGEPPGPGSRRPDDRATSTSSRSTRRSRPRSFRRPGSSASRRRSSTSTAARSPSVTRSA